MPLLMLALLVAGQAAQAPVTIVRGADSAMESAAEAVARSDGEWASLWAAHAGSQARPAVNFSSRLVVAVFLGTQPTGGFGVRITGARLDRDALSVEYEVRRPGEDAIVPQVITSPFHIVTLPRHDGAIRFVRKGQP